MDKANIIYRNVNSTDGPAMVDLRQRVDDLPVKEKNNLNFWKWENLMSPYGRSLGMVAVSGEEIVSNIAAIPRRIYVKGSALSCCHIIEVMTDPGMRRSMTFLALGREFHRRLKREKIPLAYSFPNLNSRKIMERGFKWAVLGNLRLWLCPLRPDKIVSAHFGLPPQLFKLPAIFWRNLLKIIGSYKPSSHVVSTVKVDESFQPLLDEIHTRHPVVLERTVEYLKWRYFECTARNYQVLSLSSGDSGAVAGYLVYRRMRYKGVELGVIMDLQVGDTFPGRLTGELLSTALWQLDNSGAQAVICVSAPGDPLGASLARRGFIPIPRKLDPNPFELMAKLSLENLESEFLLDLTNWRISLADNDVF